MKSTGFYLSPLCQQSANKITSKRLQLFTIVCFLINHLAADCAATKETFSSQEIGFGDQDDSRLLAKLMRQDQNEKLTNDKESQLSSSKPFLKRFQPIHLHDINSSKSDSWKRDTSDNNFNRQLQNSNGELLPVENVIWLPNSRYSSLTTRKYILPSEQADFEASDWILSESNRNEVDESANALKELLLSINKANVNDHLNYLPRIARARQQQARVSLPIKWK